jgi:hypothetical protein
MDDPGVCITPELALVDKELAARARSLLPRCGDCLTATQPHPDPVSPVQLRWRRVWRYRLPLATSALAVFALTGTGARGWIGLDSPQKPSAQPPRPDTTMFAALGVPTVPELRWAPAAHATAYELELVGKGTRVIRLRVPGTRISTTTIILRPGGRLAAGTYFWYVRPISRRTGTRAVLGGVLADGFLNVAG